MNTLLLEVTPARASGPRDLPALETTMQALALDERSPVALEIAASATSRQFLLRAERPLTLHHLQSQVQARYPQAVIAPAPTDPLALLPGEACSVIELRPGARRFLPLRSLKPRQLLEAGADPLLGILAAFAALPAEMRAVAQLAMVPASPTWSAGSRRYALEHPLEKERLRARQKAPEHSLKEILLLAPVVLLLGAFYAFQKRLPRWLLQAAGALLQGQTPHLTAGEQAMVLLGCIILGVIFFLALLIVLWLVNHFGGDALYDQHLAEEKTARPAYRVRLRIFVIAPSLQVQTAPSQVKAPSILAGVMATIQRWDAVGRSCLSKRRFNGRSTFRQQQRAERSQREEVARLLAAPYRQYHLATGGFFRPCVLSSRKVRQLVAPSARSWWRQQGWAADVRHSLHFLSIADLATLWHLPQAQDLADLAFVRTSQIRTLSVPALLTTGHGYLLGTSTHAGHESPVYLPPQCLRENLFAVASTGKGKSTLFAHLMQALVEARLAGTFPGGALLMDPHGDLATLVAGHIPAPLQDAVVLLRLADREYPLGFNPLDMALAPDRDKVTDNLIGVVEALWPTSYGARTENFLEYGSKTLADANQVLVTRDPLSGPGQQFTLLDLVPLFRSENFRDGVLDLVTDQHLKNWWRQYFANLDGRQQAEFTSSLVTKMSKFASSRISRRILGQPRSTMNFAELIGQKKIVIVSCSAGEVGADLAALFGSLFLGFFTTALAEQARVSPEERRRVLVLIDEFQVLAGVNYPTMLAELRKYGGSFGLATQSLSYLDRFDRTLRPTVLTNVDHLFGFAMAEEDARLLHLPGVEAEDVVQLPNYTCYTRLTLGGERLPLFSLRLRSPDPDDAWARQELIGRSRSRYGSSLGVVEQILLECEARQRTLKGARTRKGNRGGEVIWTGLGEERVAETLEREGRRPRDRGRGGKGEREQTHAQHAAYGQEEEAHEEE